MPFFLYRSQGRGTDLTHKQGEVESIAQMKFKGTFEHNGRLPEYIEDIIGTAALRAPIETALAEVEQLGKEKAEKVYRLQLVETEGKVGGGAEWQKVANEHVRALSWLWQYYDDQTSN